MFLRLKTVSRQTQQHSRHDGKTQNHAKGHCLRYHRNLNRHDDAPLPLSHGHDDGGQDCAPSPHQRRNKEGV